MRKGEKKEEEEEKGVRTEKGDQMKEGKIVMKKTEEIKESGE